MLLAAIPVVALIALPIVLVALILLAFKAMWKVSEPNEAMIVSGFGAATSVPKEEAAGLAGGFKIVVGKGAFVIPGLQTVRRLDLSVSKAELAETCVTKQGIEVSVRGIVLYKVGDDHTLISNAARRFLGQDATSINETVKNVFAGHLRSIIGGMTIEEMIREREALATQTREASYNEMQKLGLVIDSLQISEIDDRSGYIANLGKPEAARVEAEARIAAAARRREAEEREAEAEALIAAARSSSAIKQAEVQADADQAKARADQAGPQAAAEARKAVIQQETEVAELEALRAEKRLESEVKKPADARAYEARVTAEAERDAAVFRAEARRQETELAAAADARRVELAAAAEAKRVELTANAQAESTKRTGEAEAAATRARGEAEASAVQARGLAEAKGIQARSDALAKNSAQQIELKLVEQLPQVVRAAAESFSNVDSLTVLNGAEGMNQTLSSIMGMGLGAVPMLRQLLASLGESAAASNGEAPQSTRAAVTRRLDVAPADTE